MGIVEDLENGTDIVELVSKYVSLKKAGTNYKALCPFPGHSEKTASFVVSPSKQLAYCFGCHKGGGPLKFVMDLENCEFKDAIEILSNLTGIPIQGNFKQENFEEKKSMYALYKDAVQYYKEALSRYPEIKKYLFERGLSEDSIRNFHFGYADSGLNLYNHLKEKKYDDDIIGESGIFLDIKSKKDKFINRIIFPIQNARGDFVALAGRIIGSGEPKYLNSPASKIYDKSAILYGLYNARSAITKTGFVIVTEGYMDTISLQEGGFPNTVCVSGTALTEKHIQMIKRLTHKIYLCFDNDGAGQKATKLSLELLKNTGIEVKIIHLKGGKDPDEILKKEGEKGKEVFERLIDTAETPIAYYLRNSDFKTESIEDKRKTLTPILEMIAHYSDSIEQDSYLKETARLLNIHLNVVYDAFNKIRLKRENPIQTPNIKKDFSLEETIIANILSNESLREEIEKGCIFPIDPESDLGHFLKEGKDYLDHMELSKKERYKALVLKIEQLQGQNEDHKEEGVQKMIQLLNTNYYKEKTKELKMRIQEGDSEALTEYTKLVQIAKNHKIK